MEDEVYKGLKDTLLSLGADEQSASMLIKAVEQGMLTPEKAVSMTRATVTMDEEGGSMAAAAGATLEPVRVKKQQEAKLGEGNDAPAFKKGQEVTYLRHPAVITNVEKDMMGRWNYSVSYDKGTGKTKATNIYNKDNEIKPLKEDAPILAGGKIKDNYAVSHFGYEEVPKGHAKMKGIIVKDLWETAFVQNAYYGVDGKEAMYLGIKDDKYLFRTVDGRRIEIDDPSKVRKLDETVNEILTQDDYKKAEALLDKLKNTNSKIYNAIIALVLDAHPHSGEEVEQLAAKAGLSENYHRFKKETATRTRAQQMHEAAKAIEKRLHEVNKLLEYTSELRNELFEGDDVSEMTHHTKRVFEKVTKNIAEAYSKLKKIK